MNQFIQIIAVSTMFFCSQALFAGNTNASSDQAESKNYEQIQQQIKTLQSDTQKQIEKVQQNFQTQIKQLTAQIDQLNKVTQKRIQTMQSETQEQLKAANEAQTKLIKQLQTQLDALQKK